MLIVWGISSLVVGGVCRFATAELLMYVSPVSLGAYTTVFCLGDKREGHICTAV